VNFSGQKAASGGGLDGFLELVRSFLPNDFRHRITISTAHKFKGLQKVVVIVLDAVDRSYPLIHPDWVFSRALSDSIEKIVAEERRLFYVALTRAVETLIILTEQGSSSPFLDELRGIPMLCDLDWSQFPPPRDSINRLTVKVGNQAGHGNGPTLAIKDQLKAEGYWWVSTGWKSWCRTHVAAGFSIHSLGGSTWGCAAYGIEVRIFDDHDALIARYLVDGGRWLCIVDGLPDVREVGC
jgi:DNA helicase-4